MQKDRECGLCRTAKIIHERNGKEEFVCQAKACKKEWTRKEGKWVLEAQKETKMAQK